MKVMKALFIIFAVMSANFVNAQSTDTCTNCAVVGGDTTVVIESKVSDVSIFGIYKLDAETGSPLMWFTQSQGNCNLFLEARANFDWQNTVTIAAGRNFSAGPYWVTPKVGALVSMGGDGYSGISFEVNHGISLPWNISLFQMNQYAFGGKNSNPNFFYDYSQIGWSPMKNFSLLFGAQFFRALELQEGEEYLDWWIDMGPQLKISFGDGFYLKPWITFDPNHDNRKVIVGLGRSF